LPDYAVALAREDLDAVVIVTPTFLHRDIACLAARHGKHIFLEKPMALSAADIVHVLSRGRIVHTSTPAELLKNEEVKRTYLGV